jgi:ATP-dependent DNA ligase
LDLAPARLQLVKEIPKGPGWLYEPKFDGYRGIVARPAPSRISVLSRNGKDLGRFFPELVRVAEGLPVGTVLDGEIVQPTDGGVSFFQLQHRLAVPIKDRPKIAAESPAAFVAFDILHDKAEDVRKLRLSERRKRLERLTTAANNPLLQLVAQVNDAATATAWLDDLSMSGIEGVVAKLDEPYPKATAKRWQKIRRQLTMDALVIGFAREPGDPLRLVLGRRIGEEVRLIGSTQPIGEDDAKALVDLIPSAVRGERPLWTPFVKERVEHWFRLPRALTAEVAVTNLDGDNLRQPARFLRWRLREPPGV